MYDTEQLIDQIYEAAIIPDLWKPVLDSLGKIVNGAGTILAIRRADGWGEWMASDELADAMSQFIRSDISLRTEVTTRLVGANHAGFVSERDVFSRAEVAADPFFSELMNPRGMGSVLATAIQIPTGDLVIFHVQRRLSQGEFDAKMIARLDVLRPHLARAALLATRLKLERFRAAAEALAAVGLPAAILGASGQVLAANDLIQAMSHHIRWLAGSHLGLKDVAGQRLFLQAIQDSRINGADAVRSFPIVDSTSGAAVVGHIIPTPRRARDVFDGAASIFVLTPVATPPGPEVSLIQALFDLTPAEARIAKGIVQGQTIEELAQRFVVSRETVRSQLKSVLAKTGARRQADLVSQLGGIGAHRVCQN